MNQITAHDEIKAQALSLMINARDAQARSGRSLQQRIKLDAGETQSIVSMGGTLTAEFGRHQIEEEFTFLLQRFAEICRKNLVKFPANLLRPVAEIILQEFIDNIEHFKPKRPRQMVPLTLYQGASFIDAPNDPEFKDFFQTQGVFRSAALGRPFNPRQYIREVKANFVELTEDPRLEVFHDTPWVFFHAARNYKTPLPFLLTALRVFKTLNANKKNTYFSDSPELFLVAAVNHPSGPQVFLDEVKAEAQILEADPEFESLQHCAWIFKYAAARNKKDTRGFLRKVMTKLDSFLKDPKYACLHQAPSVILNAIVFYPNKTEEFLERSMAGEISWHLTSFVHPEPEN